MITRSRKRTKGLDQLKLRLIACAAMVASCAGIFASWPYQAAKGLGMFSFTIFAFMLAEGYEKSSDRYVYARRLLLFALLAEVPFDLLYYGNYVSSHGQNAIFSLLISLCSFWVIDELKDKADNSVLSILIELAVFTAAALIAAITSLEGGIVGIILAFAFHISHSVSYPKLLQVALILPASMVFCPELVIYVAAALLLCWMSNGERGPNSIGLRYLFYAAYPLTLLICGLALR